MKFAVALAPAPLLLLLFAFLDVFRLMSARELLALLFFGALAAMVAFPISGGMLDTLPMGFSAYSRFVAPWTEEALKAAPVLILFTLNRIGFKVDAAITGFAVGVGFAVLENIFYLTSFGTLDLGVWLVRGLGTAIMHGGATALFATVSHELTERQARSRAADWRFNPLLYLPGFLVAVAVHLLFNQFPDQPLLAMMGALLLVPMTLFLVFRHGEAESVEWLAADTAEHRTFLAHLRAGGWAGADAAPLRHSLAQRFAGRVPMELIQEYVELHTDLVLRAEACLYGQAAGQANQSLEAERAAFTRFAELERTLGRTVLAALAPSLPFSRNDLWELREFKARVAA